MKVRLIFHGVAVLVLIATVAAAQVPKKPAKTAPASQSAVREGSNPFLSERSDLAVAQPKPIPVSGMAF